MQLRKTMFINRQKLTTLRLMQYTKSAIVDAYKRRNFNLQ